MTKKKLLQLEINKDSFRKNLSRFTWQAYNSLPVLDNPGILNVGCGSCIPAIELAILSQAHVTAIDNDKKSLKQLQAAVKTFKLESKIKVLRASLTHPPFKKESFDIIWSEGSLAAIGFAQCLSVWYSLLKPHGFLVVHDDKFDAGTKLNAIAEYHYQLLKTIDVPTDVWRDEYFKPLNERLIFLHKKYEHAVQEREILCEEGYEVELFKRYPERFGTIFFIMQKI
jgi:SAM-dependent methyltransferase